RLRGRGQRGRPPGSPGTTISRPCSPVPDPHQMTGLATHDRFGAFGGRYVPETLIPALEALDAALETALADPAFRNELDDLLTNYVGRPSPLSTAPRLSARVGAPVYLKREDLNHTGAHKIN